MQKNNHFKAVIVGSFLIIPFFQSISLAAASAEIASTPGSESTTSTRLQDTSTSTLWNSKKIVIDVGAAYGSFSYSESGMNESIALEGVDVRISKQFEGMPLIIKGSFDYLTGSGGTYQGQTESGIPLTSSINDTISSMKGTAGARLFANDINRFDLTGGLGVRRLTDDQSGSGSYLREVTYVYLPVIAEWSIRPTKSWSLGAGLEYDIFAGGTVVSHLSQVSSGLSDVTNTQNNGYGDRIYLSSSWFAGKLAYTLEAYQQYWNIQNSDVQYAGSGFYGMEPANNSTMTGANFRVSF